MEAARDSSLHTIRAYRGDLDLFTQSLPKAESTSVTDITLEHCRSWVWAMSTKGDAASSIGRRVSSVKSLFHWMHARGDIPADTAVRLTAPKKPKHLPRVLTAPAMTSVFESLQVRAASDDPVALRDVAIWELMYASAIRVSELVGITLADIDWADNTVKVLGKGSKERIVPFGIPAREALRAYADRGRPAIAVNSNVSNLFVGARGGKLTTRTVYGVVADIIGRTTRTGTQGPAHSPPHGCHSSPRWRGRPANRSGNPRARERWDHTDLHAGVERAPQGRLSVGSPARLGGEPLDAEDARVVHHDLDRIPQVIARILVHPVDSHSKVHGVPAVVRARYDTDWLTRRNDIAFHHSGLDGFHRHDDPS
jgi:integrase/recombinase XerC